MPTATDVRMSKAATDLVFRARNGDQNAMGMIAEVRKASKRNNSNVRAKVAYKMIETAVKNSPIRGNSSMAADAPTSPKVPTFPKELLGGLIVPETFFECFKAFLSVHKGPLIVCTMLSFGPPLTKQQMTQFLTGVPNDENGQAALASLQQARNLQAVRNPLIPCIVIGKLVAWELGE